MGKLVRDKIPQIIAVDGKKPITGILEKNMRPVYDSAQRQGYDVWERGV